MSGKVVGAVYDADLPTEEKLVLSAMADHADHDGYNIRPSIGLIAWKIGRSERQVQKMIRELERKKILIRMNDGLGGRRRTTEYRIALDKLPKRAPYNRQKGEHYSPLPTGIKGEQDSPIPEERVNVTPEKGERGDTERVNTDSPEPSIEPSKESTPPSGRGRKKAQTIEEKLADMPRNGMAQTLVAEWYGWIGSMPVAYQKSVGNAKKLADAGVDVGELRELYDWLAAQDWHGGVWDLGTAVAQLEKFRQTRRRSKPGSDPLTQRQRVAPAWEMFGKTEEQFMKEQAERFPEVSGDE